MNEKPETKNQRVIDEDAFIETYCQGPVRPQVIWLPAGWTFKKSKGRVLFIQDKASDKTRRG